MEYFAEDAEKGERVGIYACSNLKIEHLFEFVNIKEDKAMKIEITGAHCVTCQKYTQYYHYHCKRGFEAIDCGYCGRWQGTVRPGDRCRDYAETSNVSFVKTPE